MNPSESQTSAVEPDPSPPSSSLRRHARRWIPSALLPFLKRVDLGVKVARRRLLDEPAPFNNVLDQAVLVDPLWNHTLSDDEKLLRIVGQCGTRAAMSSQELINLHRLVESTNHLAGCIAEIGVFRGGSAKLIAHANRGERQIHLFDTFSGIPEVTPGLDTIARNALAVGLPEVKAFLADCKADFQFHPGYFPDTARDLPADMEFSFVNLDMDTYRSTKNGFEFFYPRMQRGGIILCHDYYSRSCPGVKPAVDEFVADKPERVIGLWHSQIALVKM